MSILKLFHGQTLVGTVSNVAPEDNYEMAGDIELTDDGKKYEPVFAFLLSNDGLTDGSDPYEDAVYENWLLEDQDGKRQPIGIPAIENGEIIWREGSIG